jgi:hypothetical protein
MQARRAMEPTFRISPPDSAVLGSNRALPAPIRLT